MISQSEQQRVKRRWVEALRGGEYAQCRISLRRGNSFCAMGVLHDIIDPTGWDEYEGFSYRDGETFYAQTTPQILTDYGIPTQIKRDVVEMNDSQHRKFPEIADYIEQALDLKETPE